MGCGSSSLRLIFDALGGGNFHARSVRDGPGLGFKLTLGTACFLTHEIDLFIAASLCRGTPGLQDLGTLRLDSADLLLHLNRCLALNDLHLFGDRLGRIARDMLADGLSSCNEPIFKRLLHPGPVASPLSVATSMGSPGGPRDS